MTVMPEFSIEKIEVRAPSRVLARGWALTGCLSLSISLPWRKRKNQRNRLWNVHRKLRRKGIAIYMQPPDVAKKNRTSPGDNNVSVN